MIAFALKALAFIFVFFVLVHWLTGGQDEILEGPSKLPDISFYQPTPTP